MSETDDQLIQSELDAHLEDVGHKKSDTNQKKRGRPVSPPVKEQVDKMLNAVRLGAYIETAASYAGIPKSSVYVWLKRGNSQKKGVYREFLDALEKALSDAEVRDLQNIDKAAKVNWKASAWRLERKHPRKWGRKQIFGVENPQDKSKESSFNEESVNAMIVHELDKLDDDRWED